VLIIDVNIAACATEVNIGPTSPDGGCQFLHFMCHHHLG
jgi:hypothetical protein